MKLETPSADWRRRLYIGVDAGSITVKVVAIDETGVVLASAYLRISGDPISAILSAVRQLGQQLSGDVRVLGVGATRQDDQRAAFSNYGWWVDAAAPGVGVDSTYLYGWYASLSGTSMATPFVSGLAALVWAKYPAIEGEDVASAIMDGADDLGAAGWDPYYGAGRIDAARALYSVDLSSAGAAAAEMSGDGVAAETASADTARAPYRPGELIVRLPGAPAAAGLAASDVLQGSRAPGVYLIRVPAGQELARAHALRAQRRVLDAQPNYVLSAAGGR